MKYNLLILLFDSVKLGVQENDSLKFKFKSKHGNVISSHSLILDGFAVKSLFSSSNTRFNKWFFFEPVQKPDQMFAENLYFLKMLTYHTMLFHFVKKHYYYYLMIISSTSSNSD